MKYKIIIFITASLFILFSCAQGLVKSTIWEGEYKFSINTGNFNLYFINNDTVKGNFQVSPANKLYINLKGSYYLTDTDSFEAKLEGKADLNNDTVLENVKLKLSGTLNYYTGIGKGDYTMIFYLAIPVTENGEWTLERVGK